MTITSYGTGAYRAAKPNEFVSTRGQLDDLQRQLSTKQRSETYGDLGIDRRTSLDINAKVSSIDSWLSGIQLANVNLNLQSKSVENFAKLTNESRNDVVSNSYVPTSTGRSAPQLLAEEKFKQTLDLLNISSNGRYLFSGRTSDQEPVASYSEIMDGDATHAGLKTLISERQAADGITGMGRLTVAMPTTTSVAIGREAVNQSYGFNLTNAQTSSAALAATFNAGPPADVSVAVTGQPLPGDTLRIQLKLPDGTSEEVVLTARAPGMTPVPANSFEIGPNAATTAINLRDTMTAALGKEAQTTLRAASSSLTSLNFFESSTSNPPDRIPASLVNPPAAGTPADTVIWYKGDDASDSARGTASVQVDKNQIVGTGARANEQAFAVGLAQFAVLAIETFPAADPNAQAGYEAMTDRVRTQLSYGGGVQKPAEIITELGSAQTSLAQAKERHESTKNYLNTTLAGIENVTTEEVATQILALQNQLQASYQVTSLLSKLNLTNYL